MSTDRDRLLKENEDEARRNKEELLGLREAMLRHENVLNALAIERTNLESEPGEAHLEISPELQESLRSLKIVNPPRIWPKVAIGALILVGVLIGLGALGIFDNDGGAPIARQAVIPIPQVAASSTSTGNEKTNDTFYSIPTSTNANSTSDEIYSIPRGEPINILPGITYISNISYSMKSSTITLVEVSDTPLVILHLSRPPQSFFIPLKTPFRVNYEGMDTGQFNARLMVLADSKKRDLEIRFVPRSLPIERKILGVSSSQ